MKKLLLVLMLGVMVCTSYSAWAGREKQKMIDARKGKTSQTAPKTPVTDAQIRGQAAKQRREGKAPGIFDKVTPADTPESPFAQAIIASREAERNARLKKQQEIQNELNQVNNNLPEQLNCNGSNCYDVFDNPENPNEATHMAPTGLSNEIDMKQ